MKARQLACPGCLFSPVSFRACIPYLLSRFHDPAEGQDIKSRKHRNNEHHGKHGLQSYLGLERHCAVPECGWICASQALLSHMSSHAQTDLWWPEPHPHAWRPAQGQPTSGCQQLSGVRCSHFWNFPLWSPLVLGAPAQGGYREENGCLQITSPAPESGVLATPSFLLSNILRKAHGEGGSHMGLTRLSGFPGNL